MVYDLIQDFSWDEIALHLLPCNMKYIPESVKPIILALL